MKHNKLNKLLLTFVFILLPMAVQAEPCNPLQPSFNVDGVEQWQQQTAVDIFKQAEKLPLDKSIQREAEGIALKTLIADHGKQGHLTIEICSGKSVNFELKDLLSDDPEAPQHFLILANKGFFKLIKADSRKPLLKGIKSLKLITQQNIETTK